MSADLAALLEYEPEELLGRPAADYVVSPDSAAIAALAERLRLDGELEAVVLLCSKSGRRIPFRFEQRTVVAVGGEVLYVSRGEPVDADALAASKAKRLAIMVAEAAQLSGYSTRTIYRAIDAGELPAGGRRGKRTIDLETFLRWLAGTAVVVLALAFVCLAACAVSPAWAELMQDAGCPIML